MRAISFGWTTPPLLAGVKTVTRRDWKPQYAARFHEGDRLWALSKDYRYGGQRIAIIRLTAEPSFEPPSAAPATDYEAEGFAWFEQFPHMLPPSFLKRLAPDGASAKLAMSRFLHNDDPMWVVRFEIDAWRVPREEALARIERGESLEGLPEILEPAWQLYADGSARTAGRVREEAMGL